MIKKRLFGTDGVRGVANIELTPELAYNLGKAYTIIEKRNSNKPVFIIGQDTRLSGDILNHSLCSGIQALGGSVINVGVIPTPAIPFLIKELNADGGAMISASHNPFEYNGIKFFNKQGYKLSDSLEDEIQSLIESNFENHSLSSHENIGTTTHVSNTDKKYSDFLKNTISTNLNNLKIGLDCGNGATYKIAKDLFLDLGATVLTINTSPDGMNINKNCGSTNMEQLKSLVLEKNLDIGFAFDGDGDRCLAIDNQGRTINGDRILAICGTHMKNNGTLNNNCIVATVMSNMGLEMGLKNFDISVAKTNVGDRYVLEHMLSENLNLGGEESGHIIFLDHNTTGDGLLTSLKLAEVLKNSKKESSELNNIIEDYPQILVNVKVSNDIKHSIMKNSIIQNQISKEEALLNGNGRILVRVSGTEPLIRIMIEGENQQDIEAMAHRIKDTILSTLN